jgi:hypothetical protein
MRCSLESKVPRTPVIFFYVQVYRWRISLSGPYRKPADLGLLQIFKCGGFVIGACVVRYFDIDLSNLALRIAHTR